MRRIRLVVPALLAVAAFAACEGSPLAPALAAPSAFANSDAAHACQQGGWTSLVRTDGTSFTNQGDCVSYAAHGGTFGVPVPPLPVITSFTFDGTVSHCDTGGTINLLVTATFTGGAGSVTNPFGAVFPVTSGVQAEVGQATGGTYTLTVTNGAGSVTSTMSPFGGTGDSGCGVL